ncbi:Coiled-coil domain-containing protein 176 [Caenorhabditis elegans]|uniref:Coiled-coil domain-containing protein 176 n=1 Tax=Caenorhabditis elegans TaxID=6239 RepID=Q9XUF2_CAEEL|nr:Coiled-coil domain-containing protein 176 [Caenorhabditis elegans]CAB05166.1 Coiled-coil domain-containing protein 176 [Caenorhabditis elegans]|eukprot:NP_503083.1 Uncharacterized protein CELE_C49C3.7 [Caenorhabditis elegans]
MPPPNKRQKHARICGFMGTLARKKKEIEQQEALMKLHNLPLTYTEDQYKIVKEESTIYKNRFETAAAKNVELLKATDELKKELEFLKRQPGNQFKVDKKLKSEIDSAEEESKFYKNCFETTAAENVELLKVTDQLKKELEFLKAQQGNQFKVDMKIKSEMESATQSNLILLREKEMWKDRFNDVLSEKLALSARIRNVIGDRSESVEVPNDSNRDIWELREDLEMERSARRKAEEELKILKMTSSRGSMHISRDSTNQTPNEILLSMAIRLDSTSSN